MRQVLPRQLNKCTWDICHLAEPVLFSFDLFWKQGLACGCIPEGQAGGTMGYTGALLGKNHKSKPIQIKDFDADPQKPATSHLVLRAWMLQRSQANDFLQGSSCRQQWFGPDFERLKKKSYPVQKAHWLTNF